MSVFIKCNFSISFRFHYPVLFVYYEVVLNTVKKRCLQEELGNAVAKTVMRSLNIVFRPYRE